MISLYMDEFLNFFSAAGLIELLQSSNIALIDLIQSDDYSSLQTWGGISKVLSPLIPFLVILEVFVAFVRRAFKAAEYKITFMIYVFNKVARRFLSLGVIGFCIGWLEPFALLETSLTWYWFIYGYIVWEFSHFIYHYLGHKVRILWCLHSTHHVPEAMNLSVAYAHFILEIPYADFVRTSVCILLGSDPALLFMIMFIDGIWGGFIHVGEKFMKGGRLGFLERFILTPSHHRVHHAMNPLYMDTNFCNLLNIWDRIFKTYQTEQKELKIKYGIARPINAGSFLDVYFGEFYCLFKDISSAPDFLDKLRYLLMPPGWSHEGNHMTADMIRQEYVKVSRVPER